jgi:hypothetical protein
VEHQHRRKRFGQARADVGVEERPEVLSPTPHGSAQHEQQDRDSPENGPQPHR